MSVSFDWDFKDESDVDRRPGGPPPGRWRRRLILGAVVLVLLIPVLLLVRSWVAERLESVRKDEAKLRAVVDLELKTIAQGDPELFRSLQDPLDPAWQERQVERFFSASAPEFVPAPGLVLSERPPEIEKVHFFGHSGRVEMTHWFEGPTFTISDTAVLSTGTPGPLPFHLTWFYEEDEEGDWVHVEPPGDYWGIPYSWHGTRLEVRGTEIEAQRIDTTARELAILISQACLWIDCPADTAYALSFEDIVVPEVRGATWAVPALYLTGLPDDDVSLAVWDRTLKLWAIEMLARAQVGDEEPTRRIIYRHLVTRLQAALGLVDDPADQATSLEIKVLAEALRNREQHPLWSLWRAKADPDDPVQASLVDAEVSALLTFIEQQVDHGRLFELLPALGQTSRLSDVLTEKYDLDRLDFSSGWPYHLSNLTGVASGTPPPIIGSSLQERPLEPPPTPAPPATPPGDQIAANCGGRIWVGNADGSDLLALTERGQAFNVFYWSPDGRWLLTAWKPHSNQPTMAAYLLAADGSEGRLLTTDPATRAWPLGWTPDGRTAVVYTVRLDVSGQAAAPEVQAIDIETGATRDLPGAPLMSPDAKKLLYVPTSVNWQLGSAWLAEADWGNNRLLEPRAWVWPGEGWSPDGMSLAIALPDDAVGEDGALESAIGIYDMTTERRKATISATDLMQGLSTADGVFVSDGSDQAALADQSLPWLTVLGWSADGRRLLVWSQEAGVSGYADGPVALTSIAPDAFVVPLAGADEGSRVSLLAYGERKFMDAVWSPTDADRLSFTWRSPEGGQPEGAYIVDVDAGIVYSDTHIYNASWSPDGEWVAWAGEDGVDITDKDGQEGFQIGIDNSLCYLVAWNPAADLSQLPETPRSMGD